MYVDAYKVIRYDNMWDPAKLPGDNERNSQIDLFSVEIMLLKESRSINKGFERQINVISILKN